MALSRRLFFALWPTEALRTQIVARTAIAIEQISCRPMMSGNLHVTLAFIGSVPVERLATLIELGRRVTLAHCQLMLDQLAIWKQARVLVLAASSVPPQLLQLVGELQTRLNADGFKLDERPYRPHVTLAREVRAADSSELITPLIWPAQDFVLVESLSTAAGVQYHVLETFACGC